MKTLSGRSEVLKKKNGGIKMMWSIIPHIMRYYRLLIPEYKRYAFFSLLENTVNLYKFWKAGQLRRLPVSYIDGIEDLLNIWFDSHTSNDHGGATVSAPGSDSTSVTRALDSGDIEMTMDPTERSNSPDKADPLMALALHLHLISPETPLLTEEDRQDLALLDQLTQSHTRLQQVLGLETEVAATEKWNFDAVIQLLALAKEMSDIPFASKTDISVSEQSSPASAAAPTGLASKGKARLDEEPKSISFYDMSPDVEKGRWVGSTGEGSLSICPTQLLTPASQSATSNAPQPRRPNFQSTSF
jgi:hypothetical protein